MHFIKKSNVVQVQRPQLTGSNTEHQLIVESKFFCKLYDVICK
jgi:hypothetical protein